MPSYSLKFCFSFLVLLLLNSSCSYSDEWSTNKQNGISLSVPAYLGTLIELSSTAKWQGGNVFRNFYVIAEELTGSNEQKHEALIRSEKANLLLLTQEGVVEAEGAFSFADGTRGETFTVSGTIGNDRINEKILYKHYFLRKGTKSYHIVVWHWEKWREKYQGVADQIAASLELNN